MSSNLKANISLITNILLVVGTFLIAFNLHPISRKAKIESLCNEIDYLAELRWQDSEEVEKRWRFLDKKITKELGLKYTYEKEYYTDGGVGFKLCSFYKKEITNW